MKPLSFVMQKWLFHCRFPLYQIDLTYQLYFMVHACVSVRWRIFKRHWACLLSIKIWGRKPVNLKWRGVPGQRNDFASTCSGYYLIAAWDHWQGLSLKGVQVSCAWPLWINATASTLIEDHKPHTKTSLYSTVLLIMTCRYLHIAFPGYKCCFAMFMLWYF